MLPEKLKLAKRKSSRHNLQKNIDNMMEVKLNGVFFPQDLTKIGPLCCRPWFENHRSAFRGLVSSPQTLQPCLAGPVLIALWASFLFPSVASFSQGSWMDMVPALLLWSLHLSPGGWFISDTTTSHPGVHPANAHRAAAPGPWRGLKVHTVDFLFLMLSADVLSVCLSFPRAAMVPGDLCS